jgi:transcriptional antiterminator RfaH
MEQWYTLHTKPSAEYQVIAALEQRKIQTYLPEIILPESKKGRRRSPLFPCYVFAKIDFEKIGLTSVQWTPGLRRVVTFGDRLTPLPEEIIDLIRQKLKDFKTTGCWNKPELKLGDTVRIKTGPFQDMVAIFDGPMTPGRRVRVLLNILGQASRVQVDLVDLEKAAPELELTPSKRPRRTRGRGRYIRMRN